MAMQVQTNLTDGVVSMHLKHQDYIEQVPGVDRYFMSRCFNAADSYVVRTRGKIAQRQYRKTFLTYQIALRKLARRVCLDPTEGQNQSQVDEITRTRAFLSQAFFDLMGFYGVDIVPSAAGWTVTEALTADVVAARLDIYID